MRLEVVIPDAPRSAAGIDVTNLAYDSATVTPGTLYFCVPGPPRDGHASAPAAVANGAVALIVQRRLGLEVPEIVVPDVRLAIARAAARFFDDPSARR